MTSAARRGNVASRLEVRISSCEFAFHTRLIFFFSVREFFMFRAKRKNLPLTSPFFCATVAKCVCLNFSTFLRLGDRLHHAPIKPWMRPHPATHACRGSHKATRMQMCSLQAAGCVSPPVCSLGRSLPRCSENALGQTSLERENAISKLHRTHPPATFSQSNENPKT